MIEKDIPSIGAAYADHFKGIVETQLMKAGLRLASVLDKVAMTVAQSSHPGSTMDDRTQEKTLKDVQDAFRN